MKNFTTREHRFYMNVNTLHHFRSWIRNTCIAFSSVTAKRRMWKTERVKQRVKTVRIRNIVSINKKQTKLAKLYRAAGQTRWIYSRLISSRNLCAERACFANRKGTINCTRHDTVGQIQSKSDDTLFVEVLSCLFLFSFNNDLSTAMSNIT